MSKWMMLLLLGLVTILFSGCATIIHGTSQKVPVDTEPHGAVVKVDAEPTTYITPAKITMKRKEDHDLLITYDGYETEHVKLNHSISGAFFGNILLGGIIGIVVDISDGGAYKLEPTHVFIQLKPVGSSPK